MKVIAQTLAAFKKDGFVRNIGWMGASELVIRVFCLVTTVILARFLNPEDYRLAAIILMTSIPSPK
jgi:teichuronic acid exporter